ncbi:MAG: hypothetical protein WAU62_03690 [Dehalococcoidales bacterium]
MARKALITDKERANIGIVFGENPQAKAPAIQERASKLSHRSLGLSTVQRELVQLRKDYKSSHRKIKDIDKPWSLGSITDFPINENNIPLLLNVSELYNTEHKELTIRQARWLSRLKNVPLKDQPQTEKDTNRYFERLLTESLLYSLYEMASERVKLPIDTKSFDAVTFEQIEANTLKFFGNMPKDNPLYQRLHKRKQISKKNPEYISIPDVTENQVGDIVQTEDTKEIVKIVKIENGIFHTEPVSPTEEKLWHKIQTKKDGKNGQRQYPGARQ